MTIFLGERLDEQGGATAAQVEINKKREAELAKLRRDLEEANMNHESQLGALRKKHTDAVAELTDQLDQMNKAKQKLEKDKAQAVRDAEELASQLDSVYCIYKQAIKSNKIIKIVVGDLWQDEQRETCQAVRTPTDRTPVQMR